MATIVANSGSVADLQTAIDAASTGDTVLIPDFTGGWATVPTISGKRLKIQAQNFTATSGGTATRSVNITHNAGTSHLFSMASGDDYHIQLSGIKFIRGTGTGRYISISGTGTKVPLLNDLYLDIPDNFSVANAAQLTTKGGVCWNTLIQSDTVDGTSGSNGSGSGCIKFTSTKAWLDAHTWGDADDGTNKWYFEDCTIVRVYNQALDVDDNGRLVLRYTTLENSQILHHGTTSLQGGRETEIYNCTFTNPTHTINAGNFTHINMSRYVWIRAGTLRAHSNAITEINTGSDWGGTKKTFVFICESLTRSGVGAACETTYPGTHWPGFGANGSAQISDPVRLWSNTGTGGSGTPLWTTNNQIDTCGNGLLTANFFLIDRDIILSDPSYTTYTYPHPLRAEGDDTIGTIVGSSSQRARRYYLI